MRWRLPEWLEQVLGGLSDGSDWLVGKYRRLPAPIRASGWLVFQAVLFKAQPELWYGLVRVVKTITGLMALHVRTQLLLVVLCMLSGLIAFVMPKLNTLHSIVKSMDNSSRSSGDTVTDGGSTVNIRGESELSPSGAGAISGAVAIGALGIAGGPAGVVGFAVLGAMIGDELEQRILED